MSEEHTVQITLKDVYQQQQVLEKSLGESLNTLNVTMAAIKSHLESIDRENSASDLLHAEHAQRIAKVEAVILAAQPEATHRDQEVRLRSLERAGQVISGSDEAAAVQAATQRANLGLIIAGVTTILFLISVAVTIIIATRR